MVQPVANAGATLKAIRLIGQLQGLIKPQTPIGSLIIWALSTIRENSKDFIVANADSIWALPA